QGSFPGFLNGTKAAPKFCATGAPRINPRLSIAATWVTECAEKCAPIASVTLANIGGVERTGVMSLKMIPGTGKSGTSRTNAATSAANFDSFTQYAPSVNNAE